MSGVFEIETDDGQVRILWFFDDEGTECGPDEAASCVAVNSTGRMVLIDMDSAEVMQ